MSPARSQAQRAWIYANKGAAFAKAHGFDNKGKLPKKVRKPVKKKAKKKGKKAATKKRAAKKKVRGFGY